MRKPTCARLRTSSSHGRRSSRRRRPSTTRRAQRGLAPTAEKAAQNPVIQSAGGRDVAANRGPERDLGRCRRRRAGRGARPLSRPEERARAGAPRGPRPRDGHHLERCPRRAGGRRRGAARGPGARRTRAGADRGRRRRHAPGRPASARPPASDHPDPPPDRGRVRRPGLRGARRPRGRDGRVQLRQARVRPVAPRPVAEGDLLLRRRAAAAHGDLAVPDPRTGGAGASDLHGLDRPRATGATRSTRRTTRSSTSSRASPSTGD